MSSSVLTWFISIVLIETVAIMLIWWSRSPWWRYSAGRAIMALLGAQSVILGLALSTRIFGNDYPGRDTLYLMGYSALIIAMGWIAITIVKAQAQDRNPVGVGGKG